MFWISAIRSQAGGHSQMPRRPAVGLEWGWYWGLYLRTTEAPRGRSSLLAFLIGHWRSSRRNTHTHMNQVKLSSRFLLRMWCRWAKWTLEEAHTGNAHFWVYQGSFGDDAVFQFYNPLLKYLVLVRGMPGLQATCTDVGPVLGQGSVISSSHLWYSISVEIYEVTRWWSQRGWGEKSGNIWVLSNCSYQNIYYLQMFIVKSIV